MEYDIIDALIIIISYSHDMGLLNMFAFVLIALTAIMNIMRVVRHGATFCITKWGEMSILLIIASIMELIRFAINGNLD